MNTAISVYTTVTALGADCSVVNKQIVLNGGQGTPANPTIVIPYSGLRPYGVTVTAPVTETVQVSTGTVTGANSTTYSFELQYVDTVQKKQVTQQFVYTSGSVNSGNTLLDEIVNAFIAQIQAQPSIPITPTNSSHTLVLTAVGVATSLTNGSQQFTVTNVGPGTISWAATTPAVAAVGLGYLWNQGATANANITNTSYYYTVDLDFNDPAYGDVVMANTTQVNRAVVLVLSTATNVDTLVGTYGTLTQALAGKSATWSAGGTTSSGDSVANGVLTLGNSEIFYGNSDTNIGVWLPGDTILIGSAYYVTEGILSGTTAATASTPNDASAATTYRIKLRSIL